MQAPRDTIVTLELPPINPKLHSHNTGHWRTKAAAVKELRRLAERKTCKLLPPNFDTWPAAIVDYLFVVPTRHRRDFANMIQSQKAAIDGVVDAGLIPDDDWQHLDIGRVSCVVDKLSPRVLLTFRKVER